jgi:hypothetical protein
MALNFPNSPSNLQLYPNPATPNDGQWRWNSVTNTWDENPLYVRNQPGAFNNFVWPLTAGSSGQQLTTDGSGTLSWAQPGAGTTFLNLSVLESFNSVRTTFTIVKTGTTTPYSPTPYTNIVVFMGGVPQIPGDSYTVSGSTITFTEPPPANITFYAISNGAV